MKRNISLHLLTALILMSFAGGTSTAIPKIKRIKDLITGKVTDYSYDQEGRLILISLPDSKATIKYNYYKNRIVKEQFDSTGNNVLTDSITLDNTGLASNISRKKVRIKSQNINIKNGVRTQEIMLDTVYFNIICGYDNESHLIKSNVFDNGILIEAYTAKYRNNNLQISCDSFCNDITPFWGVTNPFPQKMNIESKNNPTYHKTKTIKIYYGHDNAHILTNGAFNEGLVYMGANSKNPTTSIISISQMHYPGLDNLPDTVIHSTIDYYDSLGVKSSITNNITRRNHNMSITGDTTKQYITNRYDDLGRIRTQMIYKQLKKNALLLSDSTAIEYY